MLRLKRCLHRFGLIFFAPRGGCATKKILSLLPVACLALSLAACGTTPAASSGPEPASSQEETPAASQEAQQSEENPTVVLYTTSISYNSDGSERSREVTDYRYDEDGNLLGTERSDGVRWENTYNGDGVLVSSTYVHPEWEHRTLTYDLNGNLLREEQVITLSGSEAVNTTTYTYDGQNRPVEGVASTTRDGTEMNIEIRYTYNDADHTGTRTISGDGADGGYVEELTYNENWQILTSHRTAAGSDEYLDEEYTYDAAGNVTSHHTWNGDSVDTLVQSSYDEYGNLLKTTTLQNGKLDSEEIGTPGTLAEALQRQEGAA